MPTILYCDLFSKPFHEIIPNCIKYLLMKLDTQQSSSEPIGICSPYLTIPPTFEIDLIISQLSHIDFHADVSVEFNGGRALEGLNPHRLPMQVIMFVHENSLPLSPPGWEFLFKIHVLMLRIASDAHGEQPSQVAAFQQLARASYSGTFQTVLLSSADLASSLHPPLDRILSVHYPPYDAMLHIGHLKAGFSLCPTPATTLFNHYTDIPRTLAIPKQCSVLGFLPNSQIGGVPILSRHFIRPLAAASIDPLPLPANDLTTLFPAEPTTGESLSSNQEHTVLYDPEQDHPMADVEMSSRIYLLLRQSLVEENLTAVVQFTDSPRWFGIVQSLSSVALSQPALLAPLLPSPPSLSTVLLTLSFLDALTVPTWIGNLGNLRTAESFPLKIFKRLKKPRFQVRAMYPSYHVHFVTPSKGVLSPPSSPSHRVSIESLFSAPQAGSTGSVFPPPVLSELDTHPTTIQTSIGNVIKYSKSLPSKLAMLTTECEKIRNTALLNFSPRITTTLIEGLQASISEMTPETIEYSIMAMIISQLKAGEPISVLLKD